MSNYDHQEAPPRHRESLPTPESSRQLRVTKNDTCTVHWFAGTRAEVRTNPSKIHTELESLPACIRRYSQSFKLILQISANNRRSGWIVSRSWITVTWNWNSCSIAIKLHTTHAQVVSNHIPICYSSNDLFRLKIWNPHQHVSKSPTKLQKKSNYEAQTTKCILHTFSWLIPPENDWLLLVGGHATPASVVLL